MLTLPTTVRFPLASRDILLTPPVANLSTPEASVIVQSPKSTVVAFAVVIVAVVIVAVVIEAVGIVAVPVNVGLAVGAFASICVWIALVTPDK